MLTLRSFAVALNKATVTTWQDWLSIWLTSTLNELQPLSELNSSNGSAPFPKMSVFITWSDGFDRKVAELLFWVLMPKVAKLKLL